MHATNSIYVGLFKALWIGFVLIAWALITSSPAAVAQLPAAQSPSYKVTGSVEWLLRYGLGDPRGLARKGYSRGFFFSQSIGLSADVSVAVERPVPGLLTLLAQIDNQQPEFLQSLDIRWQAARWQAAFGDFPMGRPESPFAVSDRLLKGFKVDWQPSDRLSLSAVLSQVSGIRQSKTFRGNTVEETITFAYHPPNQPWIEEPYLRNLRGLAYFPLGASYVEGFTRVIFTFQADAVLQDLLQGYDLGYLYDVIKDDPDRELDPSYYLVIPVGDDYFLALRDEYLNLLRNRVLEYLDEYNFERITAGEDLKEYPLSERTDYERGFLERLSGLVTLDIDSLTFSAEDALRQRFYTLSRQDVLEESVNVEIKITTDGGEEFKDVRDPEFFDYDYTLYPEIGVIEFDFPPEFFEDLEREVRVTYAYQSGSGTYVLGLSVLKGSERVYLNGELLQPGVDYLLEYETGFLILLREIGSEDVLRIEYETARGGLGGFSEYRRSFQGVTLSYRPFENFTLDVDLLRAYDSAAPGIARETLRTMPNSHVMLGLSGRYQGDTLRGNFDLGVNANLFPPDDNLRAGLPNRVNVIHAFEHFGRTVVLFGHLNGVTAYDGLTWSAYGPAEGLGGLTVFDIAAAPGRVAFATNGGLSILRLDPGDPLASFARPANWESYNEQDGLPGNTVYAVAIPAGTNSNAIWVGTDQGLARAPLDALDDPEKWTSYSQSERPEMLSDEILKLAYAQGRLYVGTDQGLMLFDPIDESFSIVEELRGVRIRDLATDGTIVYVATDLGVRALEGGVGLARPVSGRAALAVAVQENDVWYGASDGLYSLSYGRLVETQGREITALGAAPDAVWAGERATEAYQIALFRVGISTDEGASSLTVEAFRQAETRLDGQARGRFVDIPAGEHTDYGWIGRLSLARQIGALQLQGTLESRSPRFTPIGTLNRQDHLQINLSASYPLSPALQLTARHLEGLRDLARAPSQVLSDDIELQFRPEGGPQINVGYSIERLDRNLQAPGFDRRTQSYTLSALQKLLGDRLSLQLSFRLERAEDPRRPRSSSIQSDLRTQLAFQALPGLDLRLNYRQPLAWQFGRRWGTGQLQWGADWSRSLVLSNLPISSGLLPIDLQTTYQGNSQITLMRGLGALDQQVNVLIRTAALQLGELSLFPQATLSLSARDLTGRNTTLQWGGDGSIQGAIADFEAQINYKKSLLTQARAQLSRWQDVLRVNVGYRGMPDLRPTLEFSGSLETLLHPFFGRKANGQYQLSLQLAWQRPGPLQADLYLSRQVMATDREKTVAYSLQQSLAVQLRPGWVPRLEFLVDYIQGEQYGQPVERLDGELSLSGNFALIEDWGTTLTLTYLFGLNAINPNASAQSFAFTVRFGRTFSFF